VCRWLATYFWKALDVGFNFVLELIPIGGLHTKLWGSKVTRVPTLGISRLPFGAKCHLDVGLMERHRVYNKGEGDGFPQVLALVSLMNPSLPVAYFNTKSVPIMH
jgi:hypothetical protein